MKKTFTKIAATLSAALLGALPMANSLTASAASSGAKTYRTYIYYSGGYTQIRRIDVSFYTNTPLKVKGRATTKGCIEGWMDYETGNGTQYGSRHYKRWKSENFTDGVGNIFKITTEIRSSSYTFDDLIGTFDIQAFDGGNHLITGTDWTFSADTYLVGDINDDGVVNYSDRNMLYRILNGSYVPTTGVDIRASDIDGDGDRDAVDLQHLDNYLNGYQYSLADIQTG